MQAPEMQEYLIQYLISKIFKFNGKMYYIII